MKKVFILFAFILLLSTVAFASGLHDGPHDEKNRVSETVAGVAMALQTFQEENSAETVAEFKGIKASPNDHGVSVKVYLNSGDPIAYGCHRHEDDEPFECHLTE